MSDNDRTKKFQYAGETSGYGSYWANVEVGLIRKPTLRRTLHREGRVDKDMEAFLLDWERAQSEARRLNRMLEPYEYRPRRYLPCPERERIHEMLHASYEDAEDLAPDEQAVIIAIALQTVSVGYTDACLSLQQLQEATGIASVERVQCALENMLARGFIDKTCCHSGQSYRPSYRLSCIEWYVGVLSLLEGAVAGGLFCPLIRRHTRNQNNRNSEEIS